MKKIQTHVLLITCWLGFISLSHATSVIEHRGKFLKAEKWLQQNKDFEFLNVIDDLKTYPLYPLLQSKWLRKNLHEDAAIIKFLNTYKLEKSAAVLRRHWIKKFIVQQKWQKFLTYYNPKDNKTSFQCYYQLAQYHVGNREAALKATSKLWLTPKSLPAECNDLFNLFKTTTYYSPELIWQRFQMALEKGKKGNISLANYLQKTLPKSDQAAAALWLKVHKKPTLITNSKSWNSKSFKAADIFAHGLSKLSRKNITLAQKTWREQQHNFQLKDTQKDKVKKYFGLRLAYQGKFITSHDYLSTIIKPDSEARIWRVRVALRLQNWRNVQAALENLSVEEQQLENWRYWQARTWEQLNQNIKAQALFTELAQERSYYGFAAADKVNLPYKFNNVPIPATSTALATFAQQPAFQVVQELQNIGRETEAKRHWWFAIKLADNEQIKMAAKLAQQWGQIPTAVFTVAKAKYWDDVELRFPLAFQSEIKYYAQQQNLNPAVVFGLIRQESVFNSQAGSHVGARGLMQIMPATGKQIARELKDKWGSTSSLHNPNTNIRYGTYYYKKLVNKFAGKFALAAAGYNAGPNRVKLWRPQVQMPMDIWIETIPFDETRKYVSVVLMNTIIYQDRLQQTGLKMQNLLPMVHPK